ncbi:hypothetical protein [Nocardia farcinica]|uniref:hypothetical protein n=1 Tax=Nocardia farcinica TaxID=37329 RepID=UPI0024590B40|nr:hypothetical protein [Nocardia farcinica]
MLYIVREVDEFGHPFEETCAVAPPEYFDDKDYGGDALPAARAAYDETAEFYPRHCWELLRVG